MNNFRENVFTVCSVSSVYFKYTEKGILNTKLTNTIHNLLPNCNW